MSSEETMKIGEVADRTSLSFRTLRHYEEVGLVSPSARTDGGFRLYTENDIARLLIIRRMKPLGYTLEEMRALLDVVDALTQQPDDNELRSQLEGIQQEATERREKLAKHLGMADDFVAELARI